MRSVCNLVSQRCTRILQCVALALLACVAISLQAQAQVAQPQNPPALQSDPPRVIHARQFLAQRGWPVRSKPNARPARPLSALKAAPADASAGSASWQHLGPTSIASINFGEVSGRVTSIAFDPSDASGNRVFVGTTGGGVWLSQNAATADPSIVLFSPLMDSLGAGNFSSDASISIGAVSVQPGGTGVVLAGTGDPNDALDSYYGGGILRSTDGGTTWSAISTTSDLRFSFVGEGFAGFAWSSVNPQVVVAAVSQAYEGTVVDAELSSYSYEGLYYSTDSGATWSLARITDGASDVQGPFDALVLPHGNAVTSVVWNPVRKLFIAAVRYHGYYQSTDGNTWTRLAAQPGASLATALCPANPGILGSVACPIFRGSLAVNPVSGDTFAWTVDVNNQDQGLYQDQCTLSAGLCANQNITFAQRWSTVPLETNTTQGAATIQSGDYTLALAAVPSGQDTLVMAGDGDLWKCSLAMGCVWRNTTNTPTCMSAHVAPYQHALAWSFSSPLEVLIGNDSGLWRSLDAIGESGSVCDSSDATHFQNLNGSLGSLAEAASVSQSPSTPYSLLAGFGPNGSAGVKDTSASVAVWSAVLDGEGGPVAIDPSDDSRWYVNNQAGVAIHLCAQSPVCTPSDFGVTPIISEADVSNDGITMTVPAAFIVDPLEHTKLLVATCRVWRGPADGTAWTTSNAISPFLDGASAKPSCNGNALIRTIAAMPIAGGSEVLYAGMYGSADGGATRAGHIYRAVYTPGGSTPTWSDLTFNPVSNELAGFNAGALDISSIAVDPHDVTGNTLYVTVAGISSASQVVTTVYSSVDGGAHWASFASNLPAAPANAVVVDPQDANTVYVATDVGVYSTRQIATCASGIANCWSRFGTGLPPAPVVSLSASPTTSSESALVAGTYGRGIWMTPLWTAGTQLTAATASPTSLTFTSQTVGSTSSAQSVTITNTGSFALEPVSVAISSGFGETDNCAGAIINPGASCSLQVTFTPGQAGPLTGTLSINANVVGGQIAVPLNGSGTSSTATFSLSPSSLDFGQVEVGATSPVSEVSVSNTGSSAVTVSSLAASSPFKIVNNICGNSVATNSVCQLSITFSPTQPGPVSGVLTIVDSAGTQTVDLLGSGGAAPTDALAPSSLTFLPTPVGQSSAAQSVILTNSGDFLLNTISVQESGPFQITNGCGGSLAAQSSCSISVVFVPTQTGVQSGTLTVTDALRTQTVSLSGSGAAPAVLSASPAQLTFVAQPLGTTSTAQAFTVHNTGGSAASTIGFQLAGASATSFSVAYTSCGATLAADSSCTAQITFAPQTAGSNAATLVVSSSTIGVSAIQVALSGTGQASTGLNVSPSQLSFTVDALNQSSAPQTVTITNSGSLPANALNVVVTAPFSLTQNNCGSSLAAGASCTVGVVFTPTANATVAGSLTVGSSAYNSAVVSLIGVGGQAGSISFQPSSLTFPLTGVGSTSTSQTISLTNTSSVVLTNLAVSVSNPFTIASNGCGNSLAPGASCMLGVVFSPTAAGSQTGALTVTSNQLPSSAQAVLSATGFDFSLTVNGATNLTVASGLSAQFNLQIATLGGTSGTFSFACKGQPANSRCSFSPTGLQVVANGTGAFIATISTGQSLSAANHTPPVPSHSPRWQAEAPVAFGLLLLPVAWRRRRATWLLLALLAILSATLSGCAAAGGSSSVSGRGGSTTPPGTYTISITATATDNGLSRSADVTIVVD